MGSTNDTRERIRPPQRDDSFSNRKQQKQRQRGTVCWIPWGVRVLLVVAASCVGLPRTHGAAFASLSLRDTSARTSPFLRAPPLFRLAKRRTRDGSEDKSDDFNRWYEAVDDRATPDDVFWGEMERQILLNGGDPSLALNGLNENASTNGDGSGVSGLLSPAVTATAISNIPLAPSIHMINQAAAANTNNNANANTNKPMTPKMIEASLSEYAAFAVPDNWLDDAMVERQWRHESNGPITNNNRNGYHPSNPRNGASSYQEDQDEKEENALADNWNDDETVTEATDSTEEDDDDDETMPREDDEPWDQWSKAEQAAPNSNDDSDDDSSRIDVDRWFRRHAGSDVVVTTPAQEDEQDRHDELADAQRLAALGITSARLDSARHNAKAAAFFQRAPDANEGLDQMWVAAMDNVCFKNLVGTYRNYGIQFADNFGDWQDGCLADGLASIEDVASYKARQVYAVTGLPCIASRTSFDVEPVPTDLNGGTALSASAASTPSQRSASAIFANPRVVSGYRFNDIGMHVDYICDVLRPLSECDRVTRFRTCLCYYDGEMEIFEYGICDVDLHFANSLRTFIPVAQAINEMLKTLELTLGLVYQRWLKARMNEVLSSGGTGSASVKLRDRVLKQGRVLPNDIIDVSAFMDSMVDVNLMDECAKELSQFFISEKPTKILTVATTGLVVALPMAKYLQVPVVYARKERNVVMADTFIAAYSSKTVGKNRELLVSKSHIHAEDRVLIVDDFLSSGSSQEALLRIVSQADATAVGIGVLLEKVYDSGRQSLSGFDVPIHSLCRIASVQSGVIQLMEEEGFDLMQKQKEQQKQKEEQKLQQLQNETVKS